MTGTGPASARGSSAEHRGRLSDSARVEAFSDGVFAIAITLLVLDLRAPAEHSQESWLNQLLHQWPGYLAYLASFGYIAVIWVNHHQLFTRIAAVDLGLLWRNLGVLLGASVLPFPTAVLSGAFLDGRRPNEVTSIVLYTLVAAFMAFTWLVLFHHLARNDRLLVTGTPAVFFATERRRALLGVLAYLVAAAVAVWQPLASLLIICALPVFYGATSEGWHGVPNRRL